MKCPFLMTGWFAAPSDIESVFSTDCMKKECALWGGKHCGLLKSPPQNHREVEYKDLTGKRK